MRNNKKQSKKIKDTRFTRFTPMWATPSVVVSLLDYVKKQWSSQELLQKSITLGEEKRKVFCVWLGLECL